MFYQRSLPLMGGCHKAVCICPSFGRPPTHWQRLLMSPGLQVESLWPFSFLTAVIISNATLLGIVIVFLSVPGTVCFVELGVP